MFRCAITTVVVMGGIALLQLGGGDGVPQDYSATPLYQLSEQQLDQHLRYLAGSEPDAPARLERLAIQTLGQPHVAAALGEGTYDAHDPRPLYALDRSDTISFVEQTLAASVAQDFETFFLILQRLRYREGQLATATRNHNLLADWGKNNLWLLEDVTQGLAEGMAWVPLHQIVRRAAFLQQEFGVTADVPDEKFIDSCIPRVYLYKVLSELRVGDVVLLVTGDDRQQRSSEIGLILDDPADAEEPLRLVWSQGACVERTNFREMLRQRRDILGIKCLRLRADALTAANAEADQMRTRVAIP